MSDEPAKHCSICKGELAESEMESNVCSTCFERVVTPAYAHVESVPPDDPQRMMWHGWALREAFIAGAMHSKGNAQWTKDRPEHDGYYWYKTDGEVPEIVFWDAKGGNLSMTGSDVTFDVEGTYGYEVDGEFWPVAILPNYLNP